MVCAHALRPVGTECPALRGAAARLLAALALAALLAPAAAAQDAAGSKAGASQEAASGEPAGGVRLEIEAPEAGALVKSELHMAEVRGRAVGAESERERFDVMLAIDVSQSTRAASGSDVDGDGEVGEDPQLGLVEPGKYPDHVRSTDPGDTILAAEVAAARALLESVEPSRVRVGVLTFAGEVDPRSGTRAAEGRDATLVLPLTDDYARVREALDAVAEHTPSGATNFAAGIRLATRELSGMSGAESTPREGSKPVVLFLTDGVPSFPAGKATVSDPGDLEAALNAARVAKTAGIRINTYAIGPQALSKPVAATEVANTTRGTFTPVLEPGAIVAALRTVSFANVEDVGVVNLSTGETRTEVRLNPDGSFKAFVPVREGENRILVNALASDGSETNREIAFRFEKAEATGRMKERELARLKRMNAELQRQIEAERIRRERRRQRMERELEIRAGESAGDEEGGEDAGSEAADEGAGTTGRSRTGG